ncbi:DCN1-like protein 1 [Macadamia integrifolia]|uniref:DCN1-like protein 1 n=1 Tax=Macadamia integrifolia TaxID=60698 RepID=UPI001C52C10C|nr:DCN1-like protein 1 [Macadamia integrifolia]
MHKLSRGHRDKVQQFIAITGTSEKVALQALKASDWHFEGAFDIFYTQPQVDPQDIVMLVLSWHMKAATMCEFSKRELMGGLQSLGVDSLEKLCERIRYMHSEQKDEQKFHEIYNFAFGWAKEKGQKSLALDTAIGMW